MAEDFDYTKKLLEIEYAQVRSRINEVEDARFKLKGWARSLTWLRPRPARCAPRDPAAS